MIESREYKDWSARFHEDHAKEPIVMQMELTYRCPVHCLHCYAECYNNSEWARNELPAHEVKGLMDRLYNAGCLWFTFTGGDPMVRGDFLELYSYAKKKGFILSVMTSLVALTGEIVEKMAAEPPFSIDMTLNGATEETYEKISGVKGSFKKVTENIDRVLKAGLPLKIKTLVSGNNIHEIDKIKGFVESRGMAFSPSSLIFARLDGDTAPCRYRLSVEDTIRLNFPEDECMSGADGEKGREDGADIGNIGIDPQPDRFYRCAIGNWQWHIDPRGRLNICSCVREPSYDLLKGDVKEGVRLLSEYVKTKRFSKESECTGCRIWYICHSCPGKARLEMRDEEAPVRYFCELARREAEKMKPAEAAR